MSNVLLTGKSSVDRTDIVEVKVDPFNECLFVMDEVHGLTHMGRVFSLNGLLSGLAAGATSYFLGVTDSKTVHFRAAALKATSAPVEINFYEGATVSANGSVLAVYNKNRLSTNTPTLEVYSGPTVTDTGTSLELGIIPGSGFGFGAQPGVAALFNAEWILKSSTNYLVGITNNDNDSIDVSYNFLWYEN